MHFSNINHLWGTLIVEELIRCGADYFAVAPGSRSSPLTVSVARNKNARPFVHFDERGLAFHALGFVSATKKPAVLICTSGTAAANFYPAIIEASKKKVPLIVLTADRPPELRHTGAVQTIDQVGLFGKYTKAQYDIPCPDLAIKPEVVLTTIDQAVYQATRNPAGVVHINCMFRDPLAPIETKQDFSDYTRGILAWKKSQAPYTQYVAPATCLPAGRKPGGQPEEVWIPAFAGITQVVQKLQHAKRGIIAVGKVSAADHAAILSLSQKLRWPIFPDTSSGLRLGTNHPALIHHFDQILLSPKWQKKLAPDCILHLGGRMTSKRFYEWVEAASPKSYVMVLNHPLRNDPLHKVTDRVEANVGDFAQALANVIPAKAGIQQDSVWTPACAGVTLKRSLEFIPAKAGTGMTKLQQLNHKIDMVLDKFLKSSAKLSEPAVARIVSQQIAQGHGLFLANSMPIRDIEMFADHKGHDVVVGGNRGASGIDGTIASAAGFAHGLRKPTTLLIGDLAFLHDVNSLAMLSQSETPVIVVAINNNGGGIFSFLPIAEFEDVFEKFYGTPHGASFEKAAQLFGLNYAHPQSVNEFARVYAQALEKKKSIIIEVTTDRKQNVHVHRQIQKQILEVI